MSFERLAREEIYRNRWVNLFIDRVRFPNGRIIDRHHLLDFDHQAVLAVARDEVGRYLMVQVCRYPTGRCEWEFPAGGLEEGEDLLQAAQRELLEETGYASSGHRLLYTYHPLNGIANQVFHVVRCQVSGPAAAYDTAEINAVAWFTSAEIGSKIAAGELMDGYTLTAFLLDQHLP